MSSIDTQNHLDLLKSRHRLAVLQSTLRNVEHSSEFDADDETFLEIKAMFQHCIEREFNTLAQPAD